MSDDFRVILMLLIILYLVFALVSCANAQGLA